ncbi:MAG: hypothetical protein ACPIOQ_74415, partial [Promethearchaeia archaeon]
AGQTKSPSLSWDDMGSGGSSGASARRPWDQQDGGSDLEVAGCEGLHFVYTYCNPPGPKVC